MKLNTWAKIGIGTLLAGGGIPAAYLISKSAGSTPVDMTVEEIEEASKEVFDVLDKSNWDEITTQLDKVSKEEGADTKMQAIMFQKTEEWRKSISDNPKLLKFKKFVETFKPEAGNKLHDELQEKLLKFVSDVQTYVINKFKEKHPEIKVTEKPAKDLGESRTLQAEPSSFDILEEKAKKKINEGLSICVDIGKSLNELRGKKPAGEDGERESGEILQKAKDQGCSGGGDNNRRSGVTRNDLDDPIVTLPPPAPIPQDSDTGPRGIARRVFSENRKKVDRYRWNNRHLMNN